MRVSKEKTVGILFLRQHLHMFPTDLELTWFRLASNQESSCLRLLSIGIIVVSPYGLYEFLIFVVVFDIK